MPEDPDTWMAVRIIECMFLLVDLSGEGPGKLTRALEYLALTGTLREIVCENEELI
jgi:hypothetical protein